MSDLVRVAQSIGFSVSFIHAGLIVAPGQTCASGQLREKACQFVRTAVEMANASKSVYSEGARKSANVRMVSRDCAVSKMSMTVVVIRPENDRVNINVST